jgi:hypothetical protein
MHFWRIFPGLLQRFFRAVDGVTFFGFFPAGAASIFVPGELLFLLVSIPFAV